jgi:O-antigen ligase
MVGDRAIVAAARSGFALASIVAASLLLSMSGHHPGWIMTFVIWGLAALTLARPFDGLLVLAGVGPVITVFSVILDVDNFGVHYPEALALAFIAGACARRAVAQEPFAVPGRIAWPSVILIAAAIASGAIQAAVLGTEQPTLRYGGVMPAWLVTDYLVVQNRVSIALLFAEGLLLFLLVSDICTREPDRRERVLVMMIAGAAGAATLNIQRLIIAALRQEHVWSTLLTYFRETRVNVQYSDWNAAGSHFAMILIIAATFAARRRLLYLVPVGLSAAAIWLTGSRTAMAAVLLVGTFGVVGIPQSRRHRAILLGAALAVIVAVAAAGWLWYPSGRNDPAAFSLRTRLVLWRAGVSMMTTSPVFGVGLGGFYVLSHDYAPAMLETTLWRPHENAHNYFVQVLAELGIPGLLLFVAVIGLALREPWRRTGLRDPSRAWAAGIFAFLLTALAGHPFLVPDAAYPFWIALAVVAAPLAASARSPRQWTRVAAAAAVAILALTLPLRARGAVRHARLENTSVGLSPWQKGAGDQRFRWAGRKATFFVPSSGRSISIPLRAGPQAPSTIDVRILLDGQEADRVRLQAGEDWRIVRLVRFRRGADADFVRIDVQVEAPGAQSALQTAGTQLLMVGSPTIAWGQ